MKGLFITGTDTSVGKTWLTSRLVFHLRQTGIPVGAFKPACSGARPTTTGQDPIWEDVEGLHQAVQKAFPRERICPLRFLAPLAPPMAAQAESRTVSVEIIRETFAWWRTQVPFLAIEGVGGWKCPLATGMTIADFATECGFPVLVIAANRLGVVNHTVLTVESILSHGLKPAGVLLNQSAPEGDLSCAGNLTQLRQALPCPVWGPIPHRTGTELHELPQFDTMEWKSLFDHHRHHDP